MSHNVSDFMIRIKNAAMARRHEIELPYSNINREIGKVLTKEGWLEEIKEVSDKNKRSLRVVLKYEKRNPVFSDVLVISKPSLRVYRPKKDIGRIERRGRHTVILSTSQGIMTGQSAKKKGVGGEILFEIW